MLTLQSRNAQYFFQLKQQIGVKATGFRPNPGRPPTLREVFRRIAMLGGFLARKSDGEPGVKTLWLGFQRIRDFVEGVEYMR